jgi:hypothetical protein
MESKQPLRLVVLGDSTSFTDDRGPQLPATPHLYPNVVARAIENALDREVAVTVLARAGYTTRDAWAMLTKDRHVQFEVMMGADAVVNGICSFDHAPTGHPAALEALLPYLRPASVRHRARIALRAAHAYGTLVTGSRLARTPLAEFTRLYDGTLLQIRSLARGAAGVVMGPISHRSRYFGPGHPHRAEREELQFAIARRHGFPGVASWPLIEPYADRLNPDGVHWPAEVHAAVGEALAAPLVSQLLGEAERPSAPTLA